MKNVLLTIFVLLALLGVISSALMLMKYLESSKNEFATFEEMKEAGLIQKGWLPDYFPKSATNIREGHNIDTNRVWATFKYESSDLQSIEAQCKEIAKSPAGKKFLCPPYETETTTMVLRVNGEGNLLRYENGI